MESPKELLILIAMSNMDFKDNNYTSAVIPANIVAKGGDSWIGSYLGMRDEWGIFRELIRESQ